MGWSRERRIGKPAYGYADMLGQYIRLPKQIRPANRTEMIPDLSPLLTIANVDPTRPLDPDLLPVKKGAHTKGRPGSTLALATMAGHNKNGIARGFNAQRSATAACTSVHNRHLQD
jgi:hypothetical protein